MPVALSIVTFSLVVLPSAELPTSCELLYTKRSKSSPLSPRVTVTSAPPLWVAQYVGVTSTVSRKWSHVLLFRSADLGRQAVESGVEAAV